MKTTFLQFVLAGSVSLLAIFWMITVLLYAALICMIFICSWLFGLIMYLQSSQVAVAVDGSASVHDTEHSVLCDTVVRLLVITVNFKISHLF